ncbi:hypothetical protein VB780_22025 [Leptolyngbya sp. CCNP1308]|uniref:hypothetical protein n=1 Tax=Leptolyngbya sp. CCNP1308 TaxID=3110255 RepID=UPI002B1ED04B|nr:hypothetical protein [Leptolyngbya sp. CCNP1308]MEA5451275.1 hypothetical protein [Leptolyngbya sp. CCNP1308]
MSSHNTPASKPAAQTLDQRFTRRPRRSLLLGWAMLAGLGWLGYLPFVWGAVPGVHGLAWVYSKLFAIALLTLLAVIVLGIVGSLALCLLLLLSFNLNWRQSARQGVAKVVWLLITGIFLLVTLLPALIVGYAPQANQPIASWGITYRTVYVAFPLDDNYGELMLLRCRSLGLCRQVYRSSTDIISAGEATLAFDADTNQMGLKLEGQWVYVRSPDAELCSQPPQLTNGNDSCSFVPNE